VALNSPQSHWSGSFGSGGTGPTGVGISQTKVAAIQCVVWIPEMSRVPLTRYVLGAPGSWQTTGIWGRWREGNPAGA
jgi:hypothetical protein